MHKAVRIALIAAMGGFLFGFETAVISGAEKTIQKLWELSPFWQGFTVASSLIGTVIGSIIVGGPVQKYGRKNTLLTIAILYLISAIGCSYTSQWIPFIIFRFLGGVAVGASSVVGPMYISEISPASMRGRLAGSFQANIVFGILVAFITNYIFSGFGEAAWRLMFGIMIIPSALFYILLRTIPESPRWLVLKNREAEAIPIFKKLSTENIDIAISEIRASLSEKKENLFQSKYVKPIFFAVVLAMFNQLTGINAILYYAPRIFSMAGFSEAESFLQPIYIGTANLIFTLLAMTLIDKVGRKKLLIIGSFGMILFLALTAQVFSQPEPNKMVVVYLVGFIGFFGFSQGAVIWVFISEIFPNAVRSQGGALGSFTHWIMAAIISWTFPIIVEGNSLGGYYSFLFYALMMLAHLIFVWKFLPETKGRTLEEIQKDLGIK
ncbi:MAG: MFS transporter [Chitinophagaceae bacterium]|nr:MAG: MFS transporter [Chitinophagaceae bacterium]